MVNKSNSRKSKSYIQLVIALSILLLVNYLSNYIFERFDLTAEKRYSISTASKDLLTELDDIVFLKVYLDGDLPADMRRLRDATKEMLDEFRAYAGDNIQYEFIDPSESADEKERVEIYKTLSKQGLQYSNIQYQEGDKLSEKIIFPGAIVSFKGREKPLQLLKSQIGAAPEIMLNNSVQQLEYELISCIKKLQQGTKLNVAFLEGQGEYSKEEVIDISQTLEEMYNIQRVRIDSQLNALQQVNALIIAGPDSVFSEKDKFILDQYIMKGGKVLWLVENTLASMDSVKSTGTSMGLPKSLNLEDQLFKYGVRINSDFVLDLQSLPIPIVTGYIGNQPKQEFFPWYFFPMMMNTSKHPIVNNIDAVTGEFVSSIDTIGRKGVKKTILLTSSPYSKIFPAPARISLNMLRQKYDERQFNKGQIPTAVLLEGEFESVFANRVATIIQENKEIGFKEVSTPTKMIVVADADIIRNKINPTSGQVYALGYDRYTKRQYGNKEFILNCVNYLLSDNDLIESRSKEFKIRLLDTKRVDKERFKWQVLNTALPIFSILALGLLLFGIRKRKFAK